MSELKIMYIHDTFNDSHQIFSSWRDYLIQQQASSKKSVYPLIYRIYPLGPFMILIAGRVTIEYGKET